MIRIERQRIARRQDQQASRAEIGQPEKTGGFDIGGSINFGKSKIREEDPIITAAINRAHMRQAVNDNMSAEREWFLNRS